MKIVYLISGPRGSGKSTFAEMIKKNNPEVVVINEDEIKLAHFGSIYLDSDAGEHIFARYLLEQEIKKTVESAGNSAKIILDVWNGFSGSRSEIIRFLRRLEVECVICWYFIVPLNICLQWFRTKKDCDKYSDAMVTGDYNLFHKEADDIRSWKDESIEDYSYYSSEGRFDGVCFINPAQQTLSGFALI